jgi:hypothetical protein
VVLEAGAFGDVSESTRIGGYVFVTAADLEGAPGRGAGWPFVASGGGIEAGLTIDGSAA